MSFYEEMKKESDRRTAEKVVAAAQILSLFVGSILIAYAFGWAAGLGTFLVAFSVKG